MDWNSAWQTASAVIVSFGGAAIIIAGIVKWSADRIAEQIIKKKDFEFSQKLEALKSSLEKKNYISKTRFDLEIEIYRELSETTLLMVLDNNVLFQHFEILPKDEEKRREQRHKDFCKASESYNSAVNSILKNAPFIPEKMYKIFDDIRKLCLTQIGLHRHCYSGKDHPSLMTQRDKGYMRTDEISTKLDQLIEQLRIHIASLDVLDKQ